MQVVKKAFMILFAVWFAFVLFMPKRNLYYKVEQELKKQGIVINEGHISEGLFSLTVDDATVFLKGIDLIHVKHASFFTLLFYSSLEIDKIALDDSLRSMMPTKIDEAHCSTWIFSPLHINIEGSGAFGKAKGQIDLATHKVHLDFTKTGTLGPLKHQLKEGKEGLYYETTF